MSPAEELAVQFSAMTPWARKMILALAREYAIALPAKRRPHLQLVQTQDVPAKRGGARPVS